MQAITSSDVVIYTFNSIDPNLGRLRQINEKINYLGIDFYLIGTHLDQCDNLNQV